MTFALFSENGFVDALGSASEYWKVIKEVEKHKKAGPLANFMNAGETTNPKGVVNDINKILPKIKNRTIRLQLESIRDGLKKAKEIAIVSES